jgi:putative radical SAM enzyme (TIGR03279 family)
VKILGLVSGSVAVEAGLKKGDRLVGLGGFPVEDVLDMQFHFDPEDVQVEVERNGSILQFDLSLESGDDPGWELEPLQLRSCHCKCIFCFIDQLPQGLRSPLYEKDEDYRFSFLFGNYLTLIGLNSRDYERIFRLRLSPLYVSVHATDPEVRGKLLGIGKAAVLPHLKRLVDGGIQVHGQIVIVPGINDGGVLGQTLEELLPLYPGLVSLSVVPVGLTQHRDELPELRLVNKTEAAEILKIIGEFQEKAVKEQGSRWVFPADELLHLANQPIPSHAYYEDYPQIENGVGLIRWLLRSAEEAIPHLPRRLPTPRRILWVTGGSAYGTLEKLAEQICAKVEGLYVDVLEVRNNLMGESVTVAGLLGGRDIANSVENHLENKERDTYSSGYLPPDCLNADGFFLDDWTVKNISDKTGLPLKVFDEDWDAMISGRRER